MTYSELASKFLSTRLPAYRSNTPCGFELNKENFTLPLNYNFMTSYAKCIDDIHQQDCI